MNLVFAGLLVILTIIFIYKVVVKTSKKTVADERTELIKLKATRSAFVIVTNVCAITSFLLIFFGEHGRAPSDYLYYLGIVISYITCLMLIIFLILYAYFNKTS